MTSIALATAFACSVTLALPGEQKIVVIDGATGKPAPSSELFAIAPAALERAALDRSTLDQLDDDLLDRGWVAAHGQRLDLDARGFAILAADEPAAWLVAFDGDARASAPACGRLDEVVELRLRRPADSQDDRPDDSSLLVDVVDADGAPQPGAAIRLLWFGGCGTCGWSEVEVAVSDAHGRATLGGITGSRASWRGLGDSSTWAIGPAFAHARPALQVIDVEADATKSVRLVVPRRVPAELLLVVSPELRGMPQLQALVEPAAESEDPDYDEFDRRTHQSRSIQPGIPLALDVEPDTTFSVNLIAWDLSLMLKTRSFTVSDDPASWHVTFPIDGSDVRHVTLIATDEEGEPLANRDLAWEIESRGESSEDSRDPAAWRDPWSGRLPPSVRSGPDGAVEVYLPTGDTVGDPVPLLRLLELDRDPDDEERSGQCRRFGEAPLPALLQSTEPATIRLRAPPLLAAGRVVDRQGRPIAGAALTLYPVDHHLDNRLLSSRSDAIGRFAFAATGSDRDDVYLAIDRDDGSLLHPTHDRKLEQPGPEPLLAIRRGTLDAEVAVDAPALDLVALLLDQDIDPASVKVGCDSGECWRVDDIVLVSRGSHGPYELRVWRVRPYEALPVDSPARPRLGGSQFDPITLPRLRKSRFDAHLEVINLRGKL